ncbi:uncharacterized protein [Venturia canescens]|nr:uncharacterized protein LOC122417523 isoform X2 [Venturia canescens]XP_043287033.1 uncharacterized protein LOC122417523 isoform X2 [Venturia canescens]XP_043287038.1 uncharacterized protein LOC122417523 isoform X2 [Venturia canescens]
MGLSWLRECNLVLVLVLVIMVSSSAIELTGDNVCHGLENYTTTTKESYMEPVVVHTFTWCFQIPPRCPKSRMEMRQRWRIKTEVRQRKSMKCCEGYEVKKSTGESVDTQNSDFGVCKPHCDICEYGNCIAPNICMCEPGRRGDGCASECPSGTWGEKCSQACNCQPVHICNPIDGKCHCPPGWQGSSCNEKCPPGKWGVDCEQSCACDRANFGTEQSPLARQELASVCHHETGNCINIHHIIVSSVPEIMTNDRFDRKENIELDTPSSTTVSMASSSTEAADRGQALNTDRDNLHVNRHSVDKVIGDHRSDGVTKDFREFTMESSTPGHYDESSKSSKRLETTSDEAFSDTIFSEIGEIETSPVPVRIETIKYDNYNVQQRVERIDVKKPRVKKPSTSGPIVAVVHVSGNGSPDHDGPMIMTSLGAEKIPSHTVAMPLDVAALIVVGSVISLGLTTLAVLAILHIRSKLFETIRLSICDADKRDICNDTIRRAGLEKGNSGRISSTTSTNAILACEYETPRCMIPEHQTLTRSRPASSVEIRKKAESNYSNDYPNIRLFSNLQELLEAHYDRPPSSFRPAVFEIDGEHVYDEIPLQTSTTFSTPKRDS